MLKRVYFVVASAWALLAFAAMSGRYFTATEITAIAFGPFAVPAVLSLVGNYIRFGSLRPAKEVPYGPYRRQGTAGAGEQAH